MNNVLMHTDTVPSQQKRSDRQGNTLSSITSQYSTSLQTRQK